MRRGVSRRTLSGCGGERVGPGVKAEGEKAIATSAAGIAVTADGVSFITGACVLTK